MRFQDKVVLITGAGAGIGAAAAHRFGEEGAIVVCNSTSGSAQRVAEALQADGIRAAYIKADVSKDAEVKAMVDKIVEDYGRIDVLVNNAGIVLGGTLDDTKIEDFTRTMDVNVLGVYLVAHYVVPVMRKTGGAIVNTGSVAGVKGLVNRMAYSASKGAVISMTRAMATELFRENIRVNCVSPGTTLTESLRGRIANSPDPEAAAKAFCDRQPIGRLGEPGEIAEAILFAADPAAGFMTGENIVIDGGMSV